MDARDIIIAPVVSEKSYMLNETGAYTFKVHSSANKIEIRNAIEEIFNVRVSKVNTLNRQGKRKRNRKAWTLGQRASSKRAIVTLVEGDSIPLFEG